MKKTLCLVFLLIFAFTLYAQTYPIGTRTVTYQDPARSNRSIETVFYYPATQAGNNQPFASGTFPVIVFGHGFSMTYTAYAVYKDSLVPRGYILAFPRTEEGLSPNHGTFGVDLDFLVDKIKSEGDNPTSFMNNHLSGTFALMGHSMGGGASFLAASSNKNYNTLINFAAAETTPSAIAAAANVKSPTLMFLGVNDGVTPPADHQLPMYNALGTSCKTLVKINGGGHCYFGDPNSACSTGEFFTSPQPTISRAQQHNVIFSFLIPYLDFMLKHNMASKTVFQDSLATSSRITYEQTCIDYDAAMIQITEPISSCALKIEDVSVKIQNIGGEVIVPSQLQYIFNAGTPVVETPNCTLHPGEYYTHTFSTPIDMTAPGNYYLNASVITPNDTVVANNTIYESYFNSSEFLPQAVDFTGFTGANLHTVFPGWQEAQGLVPTGTGSMWTSRSGLGGTGNITCAINFWTTPTREWVISPSFAVSDFTKLSFDAAITAYNNNNNYTAGMHANDRVFIKISLDCGQTWTDLDTIKSSNNLNNALTGFDYLLTPYSGQTAQIAFYAHRTNSASADYDFHLDNINIRDLWPIDVSPIAVNHTQTGGCFTDSEDLIVDVINFGLDTLFIDIDNMLIEAIVDGPAGMQTFSQNITSGFIAPNDTVSFTLTSSLNLSHSGLYEITVDLTLAADGNTFNNQMIVQIINTAPLVTIEGDSLICIGGTATLEAVVVDYGLGPLTSFPNNTSVAIPDNNTNGVNSTITVANAANITAADIVSVTVNITHTFVGDLILRLRAPDNSQILLSNRRGGSTSNYNNVEFIMNATHSIATTPGPFTGPFIPEEPFSNFTGTANGVWTLNVSDVVSSDVGTLQSWEIKLNIDNEIVSYFWSTGETTPQISVTPVQTETYTLSVTDNYGCITVSEFEVEVLTSFSFSIGSDTTLCYGQSVAFDAGTGNNSILWHDMSTNQFYTATQTEQVYVEINNSCGNFSDTVNVTVLSPLDIPITGDAEPCVNSSYGIYGPQGFSSYLWSTGDTTQNIQVLATTPAQITYTLTVTDLNGCEDYNSIVVDFDLCTSIDENGLCEIKMFPNPAQDYIIIELNGRAEITVINILGQVVLETTINNKGKLNLRNLPPASYFVIIQTQEERRQATFIISR